MALTNEQIARYSRQIIVPKWGGRAQERLLSSRLVIAGSFEDIAEPLAYIVGAGVGDIDLCVPGAQDDTRMRSICDRMRDLNPDSTVSYGSFAQSPDLVFALIGSPEVVGFAAEEISSAPSVVVRLDAPGKIAILPAPPPCVRCASGDLLGTFGERVDRAQFLAMLATTEALKILSGYEPAPTVSLLSFDGYETSAEPLQASTKDCACSHRK
jgi:hypothetical protein